MAEEKDNIQEASENEEGSITDVLSLIPGVALVKAGVNALEDIKKAWNGEENKFGLAGSTNATEQTEYQTNFSSYTPEVETSYLLPGVGTQVESDQPDQLTPLLRYYSPRLFGAPPQLTNQCDMRILSSDGNNPGAVGDFYLTRILQDANIAHFAVGRARFIGGFSSKFNIIRECWYYGKALSKYNIFDSGNKAITSKSAGAVILQNTDEETYKKAYGERDTDSLVSGIASSLTNILGDSASDVDEDATLFNIGSLSNVNLLDQVSGVLGVAGLISALKTSLSVQQPFYTFEDDWFQYINNVKMMINTAVVMLGLQQACVRIGDYYYPIGMNVRVRNENDVWANYRYITPTTDLGTATAKVTDNGNTTQYVSFMIDPNGVQESITNTIGESAIYSSVINQGSSTGAEMAFITNSTAGSASDAVIKLAKGSKAAAEDVLKSMSSGATGRFTAAIASSMARSYTGDHTIYPEVFQKHSATTSMSLTIHLTSDAGDAYSYLTNILVPLFFILGLGLPHLSHNNASAYCYPPVIQCNIPGMWGTRLGMIESITINKNPQGKDFSVNGYPLHVDVSIGVRDLQHALYTSPMNRISTFLNNHTMFDYIAQISGVDKYRVNGSMRTVTRLALAASALKNGFTNLSNALMTDWHSLTNRILDYNRQ